MKTAGKTESVESFQTYLLHCAGDDNDQKLIIRLQYAGPLDASSDKKENNIF